jgi:hypothetical protein
MVDMVADANPTDDPEDAAAFARYSEELCAGIEAALAPWVERSVARVLGHFRGGPTDDERLAAEAAGRRAVIDIGPELRDLFGTDVDAQTSTPLTIARRAVRYPTEVLRAAGVPSVARDPFVERQFPDDDYDLSPATFADLEPGLGEIGLTWGAAKAHIHLARRRREGRS